MKIFLKLFNLDYLDQLYYLLNNAKFEDIYNSGDKRYKRVRKDSNSGKKWKEL
jgi:hypothetical protein